MTGRPDSPQRLSFGRDVRPKFRDKDRDSMLKHIDLPSAPLCGLRGCLDSGGQLFGVLGGAARLAHFAALR
jgi:hypothetical protein